MPTGGRRAFTLGESSEHHSLMKNNNAVFTLSNLCYPFLVLLLVGSGILHSQSPQAQLSDDLPDEIPAKSLRFEANVGQFNEQVLFRVNDAQATHFFLDGEIRSVISGEEEDAKNYAYALKFVGAEIGNELIPLGGRGPNARRGKQNYINEDGSFADVPQFSQLMYRNLWGGINAKFYEVDGQMKYDFIVRPGADPAQVRFELQGAQDIKVNARGELEFTTALGTLQKGVPYTYQCIGGEEIKVDASYLISGNTIAFELGKYDQTIPLIIDPIALKYATFLGGSGSEEPYDIFVTDEFIYLTGSTSSTDFPITTGAVASGGEDVFVTCLEKDGSAIVWSTVIGGAGDETGYGISVDDAGEVYVTGYTRSADFPTTANAYQIAKGARTFNSFLSRLSADGTTLLYSTFYDQGGDDIYRKLVLDGTTAYFIAQSSGFGATAMPARVVGINTAIAGSVGLVTEVSLTTNDNRTFFTEIEQDPDGNLWVVGFASTDPADNFPISANAVQQTADFNIDDENGVFVAKFSPAGAYLYSSWVNPLYSPGTFGGTQNVPSLDLDAQGNIYVGAGTYIGALPQDIVIAPQVQQFNELSPLSSMEVFGSETEVMTITKIPASLNPVFEFVSILPAQAVNNFSDPEIAVDVKGKIHIYSNASNSFGESFSFPYTEGAISTFNESPNSNSGSNYYVIDPSGASVLYGTTVTEAFAYTFHGLFLDEACTAYMLTIGGMSGYPTTPTYRDQATDTQVSVVQPTNNGGNDVHLAVFHEVEPNDNTINDFAVGNNTFCVGGLIYQDPNDGPIIGQEATYQSGDGSSPADNLPDITFNEGMSTIAHPQPGDPTYLWQVSRDGGTSWVNGTNASFPVYKPTPEGAGTVQYRRLIISGCCDTLVSNVASATIAGEFDLLINDASEPIYYCPSAPRDAEISISGASGNITWQWYEGFSIIQPGIISPANNTVGVPESSFSATITATAAQAGSYRLVVTDAGGCKREQLVTILPLTEPAFVGPDAAICPGGSGSVILGPAAVNPLFDYLWSGPAGFTSTLPNPEVSTTGEYTLQVKLTTDAAFCAAGQTMVEVVSSGAFDPVLTAIPDSEFCQSDDPATIGLTGTAPAGYVFQWSPNINLDNATAFNPTFDPGSLPFGNTPVAEVLYTFTALRLSDGCIFETTTMVSDTALGFAFAGNDKIGDGCVTGMRSGIGGVESFGGNYEWTAVGTTFPGGLPSLTTDAAYGLENVGQQVGTNKFLKANFPLAVDAGGAYYIDFELKASYVPFPTNCFTRDTMRLYVPPCGEGPSCPEPMATFSGTDGACSSPMTLISVSPLEDATYVWTTYSVDGVIQPANTPPQGLFNPVADGMGGFTQGTALDPTGPQPTSVIANLDDPSWGWSGANQVVYEVTQTIIIDGESYSCFSRQIIFSANLSTPVIGLIDQTLCSFPTPGTQVGTTINVTPYTITGANYSQAPNAALIWSWERVGGGIDGITGGDTPFPQLNPTISTSYAVSAQDPITGCIAYDTLLLSIIPTVANAGRDINGVCANSLVQIGSSALPNHTYQWSPAAGLEDPIGTPNSTSANPFLVVGTTTQTYTVTATNTLTGCQATDQVTITPTTAAPPAPAARPVVTTCPGGSGFTIGPFSYNRPGVTYAWTAVSGGDVSWLNNTSVLNPTVTVPAGFAGLATFRLTVSDGCGSDSRDYQINVTEPNIELGADFAANCETPYSAIGITGAQTAGYRYTFSPVTGLSQNDDGTDLFFSNDATLFVAPPNEPITYTLTATAAGGCTFTDQVTVSPPANVGIMAVSNATYCSGGDPVTLATSGQGTITWTAIGYSDNPIAGTTPAPTPAQAALMLTYLSNPAGVPTTFSQTTPAAGVYVYRVSSSDGGCTVSKEVSVVVPATGGDLAGPSQSVCAGSSIQVGAIDSPTNLSYTWEAINPAGANGTISNRNVRRPFVSPTVTTTYQVTVRDNATGCTRSETGTVTVTLSPAIADVISPFICRPTATNQDLTALIPNYSTLFNPVWTRNSVPGSPVADPTMVLPTQTTNYFLVAENEFGCTDTAMVTLRVENPLPPEIPASVIANCNASRTFNLAILTPTTPSVAGSTFEWHSADDTTPGTLITDLNVMGGATYFLFEITANGCASTGTPMVVQTPVCFDLALTKMLAPGQSSPVSPGDDVTFIITVYNQDNIAADNIVIEDYPPTGMTLNDGDWNADNTITLSSGLGLPAGGLTMANGPATVEVTYTVDAGITESIILVNQAEITSALNVATGVTQMGDTDSFYDNDATNNPGGAVTTDSDDSIDGNGTGLPGSTDATTDADNADPAQILICVNAVTVAPPATICSTQPIDLTNGASVTPATLAATWSTPDGNGTFDGGTTFGTATTYTPSPEDAARGSVILVLTTEDPAGPCEAVSAMVTFTILKVDCGSYPWDGND